MSDIMETILWTLITLFLVILLCTVTNITIWLGHCRSIGIDHHDSPADIEPVSVDEDHVVIRPSAYRFNIQANLLQEASNHHAQQVSVEDITTARANLRPVSIGHRRTESIKGKSNLMK